MEVHHWDCIACVAHKIEPQLVTSAKQCQFPCLILRPQRTVQMTRNVFRICLQSDWQIDNRIFNMPIKVHYSNPGTQVVAQNKDFGAVTRRFVPSVLCCRLGLYEVWFFFL